MLQVVLEEGATIKNMASKSRSVVHSRRHRHLHSLFSFLMLADVTGAWVAVSPCSAMKTQNVPITELHAISVGAKRGKEVRKVGRHGSDRRAFSYNTSDVKSTSPFPFLNTPWKKNNNCKQASKQTRKVAASRTNSKTTAAADPSPNQQQQQLSIQLQRHWEHQLHTLMDTLLRSASATTPPSNTTVRIVGLTILVLLTHLAVDQWWSDVPDIAIPVQWAATNGYFVSLLARPLRDDWKSDNTKKQDR